mgnify:CR=1 FL=1
MIKSCLLTSVSILYLLRGTVHPTAREPVGLYLLSHRQQRRREVYNENMELVGINIGGGTDIFGRFRYGVLIACDQIRECLDNWKKR